MKDFINNFKIPIILGGLAIIAVIATIIVVGGGFSSDAGLYIKSASGSVTVTSSDVNVGAAAGDMLKQGDVITVGDQASCIVTYKGKKNSEDNYLVIGPNTQAVVSGAFNGKDDSELFIKSGTVIGNFAGDDKTSVIIRTADSTITLKKSVSKISYYTNEFISYTDLYTFMGDNMIQLYDSLGNTINSPEIQIAKKWGRVVSEDAPSFEALNLDFDINELTAFDLKQLITIAQIIGADFPYTLEELKAALNAKGEDQNNAPSIDEPIVSEPPATVTEDTSGTIQTAEPVTTAPPPTETTKPGNTTTAPHVISQAPQTTTTPKPQQTTTTTTTAGGNRTVHIVAVVIDGEESIQEVLHGDNAVRPADPVIDGMTFLGWDGSFENITEDRTITAMFNEDIISDNPAYHTVTVIIGSNITTMQVAHGQPANLPTSVEVEGYRFIGWDKDYSSITYDITITAILERVSSHTVTFVVEGNSYSVQVEHGGSAMPTYIPSSDSKGNRFIGWDRSLDNIVNDVTITAVFASDNYHTVTFIIDNQFYSVRVEDGGTAVPPFHPLTDSGGTPFLYWDRSLDNITSDVTITAIYGSY